MTTPRRHRIQVGMAVLLLAAALSAAAVPPPPDPESTYTIRATIRLLKPVDINAMNDVRQTARLVAETTEYADVEVTLFPFSDPPLIPSHTWRTDNPANPDLTPYLRPGPTANWDEKLRDDVVARLKHVGLDPDGAESDVALVKEVSRWLQHSAKYLNQFDTWYVNFPDGRTPDILPGLEKAFLKERGNPSWSEQEQYDHELLGRQMFCNRTYGSCTSYAIYQSTVLRALGIPTRMVEIIPIADGNDPDQIAKVEQNIHLHTLSQSVTRGLEKLRGFSNHSINEVYVGGQWVPLNYDKLGSDGIRDAFSGICIRVNTFADWADSTYCLTWGKRYALGLHDAVSQTDNPYRLIEISDHFGARCQLDNPRVTEMKSATVSRAYWDNDPSRSPVLGPISQGELWLHLTDDADYYYYQPFHHFLKHAPRRFTLEAPGQPSITAIISTGDYVSISEDKREAEAKVALDDYATMPVGVAYTLRPPPDANGYHWALKGIVTVTKTADK